MNLRNRINQQRQQDVARREQESNIVSGPSTLELLNAQVRKVALEHSQKREPQVEIEFLKKTRHCMVSRCRHSKIFRIL